MTSSDIRPESETGAPGQYKTDHKKRLVETPTFRVTEFQASAGQESPWHFHTWISDLFYVVDGRMEVLLASPSEVIDLGPGQCYQVAAGRTHKFRVVGNEKVSYVLVQGVGEFDFIPAQVGKE
jgi:mannose-6-phosphate isomerase-like protein (cupin superfamily)